MSGVARTDPPETGPTGSEVVKRRDVRAGIEYGKLDPIERQRRRRRRRRSAALPQKRDCSGDRRGRREGPTGDHA